MALPLIPFEPDSAALWVIRLKRYWILSVADWVADLEAVVISVQAMSPVVLPLMVFFGLGRALWIDP